MEKTKAAIFYYIIRPLLNRLCRQEMLQCPCCGDLLTKYNQGYLHMVDGDADCYGALSKGKGNWRG